MGSFTLWAALLLATAQPGETPPPRESIMAVPAELQDRLQTEVVTPHRDHGRRLEALVRLLSDPVRGLGIEYRDDATQTVAEAYASRHANCVTYTLLFLSLARQSGLEAYPQEIDETLAWSQRGGVVYRSNHVNAAVRIGARRFKVDVGGMFDVARRPAHRISIDRLLAQFYNNRAAQLMEQGRLPAALAHAQVALELEPSYPVTWSNTGVLRLRSGDRAGAEQDYLAALDLDPENSSALSNLVGLYQRSGETANQAQFRRRLEKLREVDPFHQFMLAVGYEQRGQAAQAARHYRRAIRLHGGEPLFYEGLARAQLLAGNRHGALRALRQAMQLSSDAYRRKVYRDRMQDLALPP